MQCAESVAVVTLLAAMAIGALCAADGEAFAAYVAKFNKKCASKEGMEMRFGVWKARMPRFAAQNDANRAPVYGADMRTDWTDAELKRLRGHAPPPKADIPGATRLWAPQNVLPSSFTWRGTTRVTSVKDQGVCDCSWAFAVGEGYWRTGRDLSVQQMLDCGSGTAVHGPLGFGLLRTP